MPRIVMIDAQGIVERAKALMPGPMPKGAPHDAALIRHQIAWAHSMLMAGALCKKSDPAFAARCEELLPVLRGLQFAWACHFGRNWKTGEPVDPRIVIQKAPLDDVILAARTGPFQLYRYEPVRRIHRACRVIEQKAHAARMRAEAEAMEKRPPVRETLAEREAARKAEEDARRKRAEEDLRRFREGTIREIRFPDERSEEYQREVRRMRKMKAANAWWAQKQRVRERGPRQATR